MVKRAVVGSQLFLELLSGVHFGQGLQSCKGPGREELGGDKILGGRFDDVNERRITTWWMQGIIVSGKS
jgi:hypothetical protein